MARTACSLAPMYFDNNSGPLTAMSRISHCRAAAPTSSVLPTPGGPYNNIPDCNLNGASLNKSGYYKQMIIFKHRQEL